VFSFARNAEKVAQLWLTMPSHLFALFLLYCILFSSQVKPAKIVDKIIDIAVDLVVPSKPDSGSQNSGNNNNQSNPIGYLSNLISSSVNTLDRSLEKQDRALRIRNNLRKWDRDNPELRHEMIVRTLVSGIFSILVTNIYLSFCRRIRSSSSSNRRY